MSGGVDSSVAACLLKKYGYNVTGLFLRLTNTEMEKHALYSVTKICKGLGIELFVLDKREEFQKQIICYFEHGYLSGTTPNPCVICNPRLKFQTALELATKHGIDFVATGHYARIFRGKKIFLLRGMDRNKDQSYFLHRLKKEDLHRLLFPLGRLDKPSVKAIAKEMGIDRQVQNESQDICFFKEDYRTFLMRRFNNSFNESGPICTSNGKIIGKHKGLFNYTIGQRRGLGIPDKTPFYVIALDNKRNRLIVGKAEELYKKEFHARDVNLLMKWDSKRLGCKVKIRYRHKPAKATVFLEADAKAKIIFSEPQRAITPGQFAVFYKGYVVVGGGEICE